MSILKETILGRTGLKVRTLGFGGIPIQRVSEEETVKIVRHCYELGMNYYDTARGYTVSEERIGKALEDVRGEVILATKSGRRTAEGIWKELEGQVRKWAMEKDSILIVTGPVLSDIQNSIGENQVGIPLYYYKIVVDLSPPHHGMIAFLLPNERSDKDLLSCAISVDSLESFTGYDFFISAPDQQSVEWLEKHPDLFSSK